METFSFGEWVSRRRKGLHMAQRELAARASCATATLKKIEADERRPSRELAGLLADSLQVPPEWRETFVECARGHQAEAVAQYQKSLDLYRQNGSVDMVAYPLGNLGRLALQDGRLQDAYELITESVALSRAAGNRVGMADWLQHLGKVALYLGDTAQAEASLQEALGLYEEMGGIHSQVHALAVLGHVALARGDVARAARNLRESLSVAQRALDLTSQNLQAVWPPFIAPLILDGLLRAALVAVAQGDLERAATLLSSVGMQCTQKGYTLEPPLQAASDAALRVVRTQLSEAEFNHAREAGATMSLGQILSYALET